MPQRIDRVLCAAERQLAYAALECSFISAFAFFALILLHVQRSAISRTRPRDRVRDDSVRLT
jgi:hypothetical protein